MKKFFEKYDLIKLSGIILLLAVLLTWIIPQGGFQGGEMQISEITRIDFQTFAQYSMLGLYYFTALVTFLFVLGGFYQVLSKTAGYQAIIKGISKDLKGHETIFAIVVSLLIAVWTSMANEYIPILVIIPFIITILNRVKVDKLAAFSTTFGAVLVGILGSVYSSKVAGYFTETFTNSYIIIKWILLFVGLILLNVFTVLRMKSKNKDNKEYDLFEIDSVKSEVKQPVRWTYAIMLILIALTVVLAYLPWTTWKVEVFTKATEWVNKINIAGAPVISYLFGTFHAFGATGNAGWSLFSIQFVLIFATLLMHWFGRISLDDIITSIGEGMKKIAPLVIVTLIIYATLLFSLFYPVVPVIINWIAKLSGSFNVVLAGINAFIGSVFGVEPYYVMNLAGSYYAGTYAANNDILAIIFQSVYGLTGFFAPTSVILFLGLSYMGISYRDWMKYIWKFLLAMLVVIIVIVAVMSLAIL